MLGKKVPPALTPKGLVRYGAAWASYRAGDQAEAVRLLQQAARAPESPQGSQSVPRALQQLQPGAVLRNVRSNARRVPITADPARRFLLMMSSDGRASARSALLVLRARGEITDADLPEDMLRPAVAHAGATADLVRASAERDRIRGRGAEESATWRRALLWGLGLLAVVAALLSRRTWTSRRFR